MSPGVLGTCAQEWGITKPDLVVLDEVCAWLGKSELHRGAGT